MATDILDLVSGYLTLKKRGQNYFGLCPFHQEKTPSFSVNPEKQIFYCFGCQTGGNVFAFLMQYEGVSFPEAVKMLAQRAGIPLEFEEVDPAHTREVEALYSVNEFAARFYAHTLWSETGKAARDYLASRGLSDDDLRDYGLGYAASGWDHLVKRAQEEQVELSLLEKAGLVVKREAGGTYDRFRDRIIFPIYNLSGKVVAFGGRRLHDDQDTPKYINSPETAIYEKGKHLYGLYHGRDEVRKLDRAIFVEGYMDLLSLVCHGVRNVAATLGTALTTGQAHLIRRYTKNVVLMYDSDSAGSAATLRGADVLLAAGLAVSVAELPAGHDPDSFVREHGTAAVRELVAEAKNLFDYRLQQVAELPPQARTQGIRSLLQSLAKVPDRIDRSLLLARISQVLEINEKTLWDELESIIRQTRRRPARQSAVGRRLQGLTALAGRSRIEQAVEDLVRILLHHWDVAETVFTDLPESVKDASKWPILAYLRNCFTSGGTPRETDLVHRFQELDLSAFIVRTFNEKLEGMDFTRWATDCVRTIKKHAIDMQLQSLREEILQLQQQGEPVTALLKRCMELEQAKNSL
ncbi:MAG: DNA primase [Calditrichaeota bacterium]|nr:MAG: DNA primase [Calditrichota bacterium]